MKSTLNAARLVLLQVFFILMCSISNLSAQQPSAPMLSPSNSISKNAVVNAQKTNQAPRYIDGYISWARDLANPAIYSGFGMGINNDITVAHRYDTADLAPYDGKSISKVSFIPTQSTGTFTAKIWIGGDAENPGQLVAEATFSNLEAYVWNEVNIVPSIQIDATQELWIGIHCAAEQGYPLGFDVGPQVSGKGNLYNNNGSWELTGNNDDPSDIMNYLNFCIKAYLQNAQINSINCPQAPLSASFTPAPNFGLSTSILWTNPTSDFAGNALTELTSIIITRNGELITTISNPTPGQACSYIDSSMNETGWYDYAIFATNSNGSGMCITKTIYVGHMIIMNSNGTTSVNTDKAVLYDNGGKFGWYALNCSSILTVYPNTTGRTISIYGTFEIESNWDKLIIYDGANVTSDVLGTYTNTEGGTILELTSATGPLTFQFTSDNSLVKEGFEIFIESIALNTDCLAPTSPSVDNVTENSASISWTPGSGTPESFTVAYKLSTDSEYTEITGIETAMYTISDLTASSEYQWKVRTTCSNVDDPSSWSAISTFQTTCQGLSVPIFVNFESPLVAGDVPQCWQQYAVMDADWLGCFYPCIEEYTEFAYSGNNFLKFWTTGGAIENTIALQPVSDSIKTLVIKFQARYNVNNPTFEMGVMEGNSFVTIQQINLDNYYQEYSINMSNYTGSSNRFAFRASYNGIAHVYIDDISISTAPTQYTIEASAGSNGSISPNGNVVVNEGENQVFTIVANEGYQIADVLVDGSSVGNVASYTFEEVSDNHTIAASFESSNSIDEVAQQLYSIYPNPANSSITIEGNNLERISIYNIVGKLVDEIIIDGATLKTIATNNYQNGTYIFKLKSTDGNVSVKHVVINH